MPDAEHRSEDATATERGCSTDGCAARAEFYWHDAGPFGAGTFYGCAAHAPAEGASRIARAVQTGHSRPGHTFGPGFAAWRFLKNLATKLRRPVIERREGAGWCMTDPTPPPEREVPVLYGYKPVCPLCRVDPCYCGVDTEASDA